MLAALAALRSLVPLGFIAILLASVLQEREPAHNWWGGMAYCYGMTGIIVWLVIYAASVGTGVPAGEAGMVLP